jgi:VWFA-related protein
VTRPIAGALAALLALPLPGSAAPQQPDLPRIPGASAEVVRVDAVVTDGKGRYVTDLAAADFELTEDGKRQDVTNFQYVVTGGAAPAPVAPDPLAPPVAPAVTAAGARRTIAIVVDDLSFTFEGLVRARGMLSRLIDEQLGPGDLAAIVRTGGGIGNLQQFTSDKLLLHAAARGIPPSLARLGALNVSLPARPGEAAPPPAPGRGEATPTVAGEPLRGGAFGEASAGLGAYLKQAGGEYSVHRALGTITVFHQVVKALARMPGRKSLVLLSEGFAVTDGQGDRSRVDDQLRALAEQANRGSVVVYTLDPGGLSTLQGLPGQMPSGAAGPGGLIPIHAATAAQREARTGAIRLAEATGGLSVFDSNDLDAAVGRVFADQQGYYLIGYQPAGTAGGDRLHRLDIKVQRRGLRVRSRRAFASGGPRPEAPATDSFTDALYSPFAATEIPIKLTVLYNQEARTGAFLRCLVHVDARQLTLEEGADGARTARVEAAVVAVEASGRVAQRAGGTYAFALPRESAAAAVDNGLVVTLDLPVEGGPHQVRTAIRDTASARAGSASQFVSVPDMRKRPLALSGLFMSGVTDPPDPEATAAVRRFRGGSSVAYAFGVYNARAHKDDGKPRLSAALLLFRDGRRVADVPIRVDSPLAPQEGVTAVSGSLRLSAQMEPGSYMLEVLVKDELRPEKESVAVQWIDFEIAGAAR